MNNAVGGGEQRNSQDCSIRLMYYVALFMFLLMLTMVVTVVGVGGDTLTDEELYYQTEAEKERIYATVHPDVYRYYKVFQQYPWVPRYHDGSGFDEDEVAGAVATMVEFTEENSYSVTPEVFDQATQKYFGMTLHDYNTEYTRLTKGGAITSGFSLSTRWDGMLKDITHNHDGSITATVYAVPYGVYGRGLGSTAGDIELFLNHTVDLFGYGNLPDSFGEVTLKEVTFFERFDENGDFYLEFVSAKDLDTTTTSYTLYSGKPLHLNGVSVEFSDEYRLAVKLFYDMQSELRAVVDEVVAKLSAGLPRDIRRALSDVDSAEGVCIWWRAGCSEDGVIHRRGAVAVAVEVGDGYALEIEPIVKDGVLTASDIEIVDLKADGYGSFERWLLGRGYDGVLE